MMIQEYSLVRSLFPVRRGTYCLAEPGEFGSGGCRVRSSVATRRPRRRSIELLFKGGVTFGLLGARGRAYGGCGVGDGS